MDLWIQIWWTQGIGIDSRWPGHDGKNLRNIVEKYGKEDNAKSMMYCLPCITEAKYVGAKEATIPYLKIWLVWSRDKLNY